MESEPVRVLRRVTEALERVGVLYAIGGSFASSMLGEPRATHDIDVAARLAPEHVDRLVAELSRDFFVDDVQIRSAVAQRRSFNVLHRETMTKIDIFVSGAQPFEREQIEGSVRLPLGVAGEPTVSVSRPEHMVLRKLQWFVAGGRVSERQWRDVQGILRVQRGRLDHAYLHEWAAQIGVEAELERALGEAGEGERGKHE